MNDEAEYTSLAQAAGYVAPMEGVMAVKRSLAKPGKFWLLVQDPNEDDEYFVSSFSEGDFGWMPGAFHASLEAAQAEFDAKE